jgi:hypothetical protein
MKSLNKELLEEILYYIICSEERDEIEYGTARTWEEIVEDGDIPQIYIDVNEALEEIKQKDK